MLQEGPGQLGMAADAPFSLLDLAGESAEVIWGETSQVGGIEMTSEVLDGVEFGGVGGR